MSGHTPGPWTIDPIAYCLIRGADNFAVASAGIATDNTRDLTNVQNANARLIAAAPDLLEALKGVLRVADRATVEFDAARAAIAKAEGTTP